MAFHSGKAAGVAHLGSRMKSGMDRLVGSFTCPKTGNLSLVGQPFPKYTGSIIFFPQSKEPGSFQDIVESHVPGSFHVLPGTDSLPRGVSIWNSQIITSCPSVTQLPGLINRSWMLPTFKLKV